MKQEKLDLKIAQHTPDLDQLKVWYNVFYTYKSIMSFVLPNIDQQMAETLPNQLSRCI